MSMNRVIVLGWMAFSSVSLIAAERLFQETTPVRIEYSSGGFRISNLTVQITALEEGKRYEMEMFFENHNNTGLKHLPHVDRSFYVEVVPKIWVIRHPDDIYQLSSRAGRINTVQEGMTRFRREFEISNLVPIEETFIPRKTNEYLEYIFTHALSPKAILIHILTDLGKEAAAKIFGDDLLRFVDGISEGESELDIVERMLAYLRKRNRESREQVAARLGGNYVVDEIGQMASPKPGLGSLLRNITYRSFEFRFADSPQADVYVDLDLRYSDSAYRYSVRKMLRIPGSKRDTWRDPVTGMEFVWIPPGEFMMGSNSGGSDEKPVHRVRITKGFWMGKYQVTQGQWRAVMGSNPSYFQKGDNYPVEQVSWVDAQEFIRRLNSRSGQRFRLPTEAEWEYACRAGTTGERYGNLHDIAWHEGNSGRSTQPVGRKQPNAFGLYDMLGNVLEWIRDWWDSDYYGRSPVDDPPGPSSGSHRVLRGGSWFHHAQLVRAAIRHVTTPPIRDYRFGFRLARTE